MIWETMIYTAITLLVIIVTWEWLRSRAFNEGFTDGIVPEFFGKYFPRRSDFHPGQEDEPDGWIRNLKYFEGYMDIQNLGYKADFCRVVEKENMPESRILACALAGQEGLDSLTYRTESTRSGMKFSRDDYIRDVNKDGRDDYGRILKVSPSPNDRWEAKVVIAGLTRFRQSAELTDNEPPPNIAELLWFYEGIMVWYRWFDDMLDYGENTQIKIAGKMSVDETPQRTVTLGLAMNRLPAVSEDVKPPSEQFLKIGENSQLEFDTIVQLRQLRCVSVWAYFDEFTNNARIFDFGNGAGKNNILLGIEGKGNVPQAFGMLGAQPSSNAKVCNTRAAVEVSPQNYLSSSDANVDEWTCPGPEPVDTTFDDDTVPVLVGETKANLLFEIWDINQRKMRIRVLDAIPLKKWVHICATTTNGDLFRPVWQIYIDGVKMYEEKDGHMPLTSYTTNNYIGRSNWEEVSASFQNPDERFRGALFDFRMYRIPMSVAKLKSTLVWGQKKLGLPVSDIRNTEAAPNVQLKVQNKPGTNLGKYSRKK